MTTASSDDAFTAAAATLSGGQERDFEAELQSAKDAMAHQIAALKTQGGAAAQIAEQMERSLAEEGSYDEDFDDDVDAEPFEDDEWDDHPFPAINMIGVNLAHSHMFYDTPYLEVPYDDRDRQTAQLVQQFATTISNALSLPATPATFFHIENDDLFFHLSESEAGMVLGDCRHYWRTQQWTYLLCARQEDKELPIDIDFERLETQSFDGLVKALETLRADYKG